MIPGRRPATYIPHVVAWNLTRRCNLACAHCYIAAGGWHSAEGELTTAECRRIMGEIVALSRSAAEAAEGAGPGEPLRGGNPAPLFILSGGEPLLREDLEELAAHAVALGATVVVGTNGTRLTDERIGSLQSAGVSGVALSVDSLDASYHDRFRHGHGALVDTLAAVERLQRQGLDFIIQTTVTRGNRRELSALAGWAAERGAVAFNVYFLVATGRGAGMRGLEPRENDEVLVELLALEQEYRGRMMVRSKCQPQIMRHAYQAAADSPLLNYETRCPCGVQYCRITPEGKLTPCPYLPAVAGDLRRQSFAEVWTGSALFRALREGELGGKCGRCEYRKVCGGCRARAFAEGGDYLGPDLSCAYEPSGEAALVEPRARVTYGMAEAPGLRWTPEARQRIARVPSFVRAVVVARVEEYAREHRYAEVTAVLLDEVRQQLPVDFSKRRPFFLRARGDS